MDTTKESQGLPVEVEAAIAGYRSEQLDEGQAAEALPRLRELVRAARPGSAGRARCFLTAAGAYLSAVAPPGRCDVRGLLTEAGVSRWSHRVAADGSIRPGTLQLYLGCLNRLLAVRAGLAAPARSAARPCREPVAPYGRGEVDGFVAALAGRPEAIAVLVALVGAGVLPRDAAGGCVRVGAAGPVFVASNGAVRPIVDSWREQAGEVVGVRIDPAAWREVRRVVVGAGYDAPLVARLRMTWAFEWFSRDEPLAVLLRGAGVGIELLTNVAVVLARPEGDDLDRLLRG